MTRKESNRKYMKKYRQTNKNKSYNRRYFKDYFKRDYAREAKNNRQRSYRKRKGYPPRNPEAWFNWYLSYTYNITRKEYDLLLQKQNSKCAICQRERDTMKKRLAVDHDHKTGKVRGLLCNNCNSALGNFRDSIQILRTAVKYLKEFK